MVMVSMVMNAEEIYYTVNNGAEYWLDPETHCAHCYGCTETATHIVIPESITYDGANYVVTEITGIHGLSLLSIKIKALVTSLGSGCFNNCTALQTIEIPSSVTSLGYGCFGNCTALKSIEIPSSVTSLGEGCFGECYALTSIKIPSSVTSLGDWCFYNCI